MSHALISRSPDLKKLRDDGYDVTIVAGFLVVGSIPYVNSERTVQRGELICPLDLAGDVTTQPSTHVMHFRGETPCNRDGSEIVQIQNATHPGRSFAVGLTADLSFSSKPPRGHYLDYYEKVTAYARILSHPAESLDASATPQVFPVHTDDDDESPFQYIDTASSRADIESVNRKLRLGSVAIVGLGGTGAYILDQVAKTPVREIRIIDEDVFHQHNAFRAPGAASIDDLRSRIRKVDYYRSIYSRIHRGITAYPVRLTARRLKLLAEVDFAFLCFDDGPTKRKAIERLVSDKTPFVDVGMGLQVVDDKVTGLLRVTSATTGKNDHVLGGNRIPLMAAGGEDDYATNIQVCDLNALNAVLAVIKWKKICGFYMDLEREHHTTYMLNANELTNEESA